MILIKLGDTDIVFFLPDKNLYVNNYLGFLLPIHRFSIRLFSFSSSTAFPNANIESLKMISQMLGLIFCRIILYLCKNVYIVNQF